MKKIITAFLLLLTYVLACTGDCLSCHPKLKPTIQTDLRHKPMLTCKKCHMKVESGVSECGKDCFTCHPMENIDKSVAEHKVIQGCKDCHVKIPKIFNSMGGNLGSSMNNSTLRDLIFKP